MARSTLKERKLSEAEHLWLTEASNPNFDPKIAKIKLHGRIPDDFDPRKFDVRLYANNKLTSFGLYLLNPEAPIFRMLDRVVKDIRSQIFEHPGIDRMLAIDVAERTNLPEEQVGRALHILGELGGFFSSYSVATIIPERVTQFSMTGDSAYDEFIRYKSVDDLMERVYAARAAFSLSQQIAFDQFPFQFSVDEAVPERPTIRSNVAFVMMAIDPNRPDLEDIYNGIKDTCAEFGITAQRADLIEHQGRITDRVLEEIATCEFLIADLSNERPNVYYEVGYAHALNREPILYRSAGTRLHFDLSVHNVPEYKNVTHLRELLSNRLKSILDQKLE